MAQTKTSDKIGKSIFAAAAVISIISVVAIFGFLIAESIPALNKIGFFNFLFGNKWAPDREATYDQSLTGSYGIAYMIAGTFAATAGALIIGGITGFFTAVFLVYYCPKKLKRVLISVINLLAGIPSIIYGFFGMVFLLPMLAMIAPNDGSGLLATSLVLGIMIMPTVVSLSRTSLEAVPQSYYEGSVALGSTHSRTVFSVMCPAAKSGIFASLVLGIGRALGETMAVVMVSGNSVAELDGLFSSFRVLTANIVTELGYAGEVQKGALIATGLVLLFFVLIINILFAFISGKVVKKVTVSSGQRKWLSFSWTRRVKSFFASCAYKIKAPLIGKIVAICAGAVTALSLAVIIGFIFVQGLPTLISQPQLLYAPFKFGSGEVTLFPSIITTLETVALSIVISVPIGLLTAIFINEYASRNFFMRMVRSAIDVLAGIPSIVYGLFGTIVFVPLFSSTVSIAAGTLTISMMLLPTIVRSTEESLKSVPMSLREGSYALGAGKVRTIFKTVVPSALPGIMSAIILSMGRVISESAPFIWTMGSMMKGIPHSITDSGTTLAVAMYQLAGEGWHRPEAYAAAVVLIVVVLALNFIAELLVSKLGKKLGGKNNG